MRVRTGWFCLRYQFFTGDLFSRDETGSAYSTDSDRTRWIEVLKGILQDESEFKKVVTGHFGILSRERLTRVLDSFMIQ
jgi:hypothetical protein